jgi:hypothetical protein
VTVVVSQVVLDILRTPGPIEEPVKPAMDEPACVGYGTIVQRESDSTPGTWEEFCSVIKANGPTLSKGAVEFTHMKSPGRYREWKPAWRDGGALTLTAIFSRAARDAIVYDYHRSDDTSHRYRMILPDLGVTTVTLAAFVSDVGHEIPLDEGIRISATFKISGQPVFTWGY